MQGHSDEEEAEIHEEQQEPAQSVEAPAPQPPPCQQNPADQLMLISAAAYKGAPSESTISLLLSFRGNKALALADTGSTNTFMDYAFAVKNNIKLTASPARKVVVDGGGQLTSDAIAYNCTFSIQGHSFTTDFRILELQGSEVILGVNWFKHN